MAGGHIDGGGLPADALGARLARVDHVAGENERPWYIALLLGTAGWFAGVFLLFFVFMLFKPESGASALFEGVVLLAAAWTLFAVDRDGAFVSQLALALSVAGQFALVFGVHETLFKPSGSIASVAFVALLLQLALTAAMPNRMHRTMTTLFACVAWAIFVRYGLWDLGRPRRRTTAVARAGVGGLGHRVGASGWRAFPVDPP